MSPENSAEPQEETTNLPATRFGKAEPAPEAQPAEGNATSPDDISPEPPNDAEVLAEQEETPTPSTVHSAAPAGTTEDDELKAGREKYGEFYIGMWGDRPNFGCPYCNYADISGNGFMELHVLAMIDSGDLRHMAALQLRGE